MRGGGVFADQTVENGGNAVKPQTDPVRTGWTFDGWYLGDVEYTFTEAVTSDITLVAKYTSVLGGSGTKADPFTVDNADELRLLAGYIKDGATEFADAAYVQTADIVSTLTSAIPSFNGVYDGRGYTLTVAAPMFAEISGTVQNLTVTGNVMSTEASAGIVADTADGATLSRVTVGGSIANADGIAGGLVGIQIGGRIEYSTSTASVSGSTAGGIVGESAGVVINGLSSATVAADRIGGGAVGVLKAGGLLQNFGFDGSVTSDEIAGGAVGIKHADSAAYRAFVYGDAKVRGETVGGLIGKDTHILGQHADVADCFVTDGVTLPEGISPVYGEERVGNLDGLVLPQAVWNTDGAAPELKAQTENAPATVELNVNGNATDITYGSHVDRELFTVKGMRFSTLIEADTDVTLKTAMRMHNLFAGSGFVDADAELSFKVTGADIKADGAAQASTLTHVVTYGYVDIYEYTPEPGYVYEREYDAPVSIYTDGEKNYAFILQKEQIQLGYAAFLESYVQTQNGWEHVNSWYPKTELPVGAFSYVLYDGEPKTMPLVIIDGEYKVENGSGYYLTSYVNRVVNGEDQSILVDKAVVSKGFTFIFAGESITDNDFKISFAYGVNLNENVDYIILKGSTWFYATGADIIDQTVKILGDTTWYDGKARYDFDIENGMVSVAKSGSDVLTVPFSTSNGILRFTLTEDHSFKLVPTIYGSYKFISMTNASDMVIASYISGAFDGRWITASGDVIVIESEPAASVTFNDKTAQANEAVYNGVQAVRFLVDDKEYHLLRNGDDGVSLLIEENTETYAFEFDMLKQEFGGDFVSVVNGERYDITITDDLKFTIKHGIDAVQTVSILPQMSNDGAIILTATIGKVEYFIDKTNDVLNVVFDSNRLVFTDSEMFALFVGEYTNGAETLVITENGTFARYVRDDNGGEYTALTAVYREDRAEVVGENRGFVLSYGVETDLYFFYADSEARNIRLYREYERVNNSGKLVIDQISNFVEPKEIEPLFGAYKRVYNNEEDILTFSRDGKVTRQRGIAQAIELEWYPLLNYNYNTKQSNIMAYVSENVGVTFKTPAYIEPTGISWGGNAYIELELFPILSQYTEKIFVNDSTMLAVRTSEIVIKYLNRVNGVYVVSTQTFGFIDMNRVGSELTFNMSSGRVGTSGYLTAVAVLSGNGDTFTVDITVGEDQPIIFQSEDRLNYKDLLGEYEYNGDYYVFEEVEGFFGSVSIELSFIENGDERIYRYNEGDIVIMSDGSQALRLTMGYDSEKYIWKVDGSLQISNSLDASKAISAKDATIDGMPSFSELQNMLEGKEFVSEDGLKISFKTESGPFGAFNISDGNFKEPINSSFKREQGVFYISFGKEGDPFSSGTRFVKVYFAKDGTIEKLMVGETEQSATKEYKPANSTLTVEELILLLNGNTYTAADKTTISFVNYGTLYCLAVGDVEYDLGEGTFENNIYTLYCIDANGMGNGDISITVTLSKNNAVEKIVVENKEYFPSVELPTTEELKKELDGKKYVCPDDETMYVQFDIIEGIFGGEDFQITIVDYEGDEGTIAKIVTEKKDDATYTFNFTNGVVTFDVVITLNSDGTVLNINAFDTDYIPE